MTSVCIVQARMGSTRLPGKVLADLGGRPMLEFLLGRLRGLPVDHLVVATSDRDIDDPVEAVAAGAGVEIVRGPELDVLARFGLVLDRFPAETVIRLTADCPFVDPEIVAEVVALHRARDDDYTTNVLPRTYPAGLDVEVARSSALRLALAEAREPAEREHVMPFLYRRPERFRLGNLRSGSDLGHLRWVVDTPDDLERARAIVEHFAPETRFGWRAIRAALDPAPEAVPDAGLRLRLADLADSDRLLAWRNDPDSVRFSATGRTVDPTAHAEWLRLRIDDPGCRLWIAECDGEPVGQLRLDVEDGIGTVSIAVDPRHRGKAFAARMLRLASDLVRDEVQFRGLRAMVHPENQASLRAFEHAGYSTAGVEEGFTVLELAQVADAPSREMRT